MTCVSYLPLPAPRLIPRSSPIRYNKTRLMTIPSRYFHSRFILLFLIINTVLVLIGSVLILFRLDSGTTTNYIIEYRANYGIGEYERGFALDMAGFIFFLLLN